MFDDAIPVTLSQADIWLAQQFLPDVPFAIAFYVDIIGALDVEAMVEAGSRAHREFSSTTMRICEVDGMPLQRFVPRETDPVDVVDFRGEDQPEHAATQWMNEDGHTPFPLDGQLVRLRLLRIGEKRAFWYTRAHHIALDGYASMKVIERAAALYAAVLDGARPEPSTLTTAAAVLAEDQRYRASTRADSDRAYWRSTEADYAEPPSRAAMPSSVPIVVGEDRSISSAHRGSARPATSTVVIAAFAAFLARMNETDDLSLSLPVSGRPTARLRKAGSSMSTVVPLRLRGIGSATANGAIKAVEVALGGVLRHQRSRPPASESGIAVQAGRFGPTINVMMFANTVAIGDFDGQIHILTTGPVSDLSVNIYPGRAGVRPRIDFEANPALYTIGDLTRLHERFLHFLDCFAEFGCGDTAVAELDLFLPLETPRAPASVGAAVAEKQSLKSVFSSAIIEHWDRIAVHDADRSVTYRELGARVDAVASSLQRRGIGIEDRVAVRVVRSLAGVVAFWAIVQVRAVYVPVDPNHPRERALFVLRDSGAVLGLCTAGEQLGEVDWLDLDDLDGTDEQDGANGDLISAPHRGAYVIYTSGSTGTPKGVLVTHDGIDALVQQIRASYDLDAHSRVCHLASPGFDTAIVEVLAAATAGAAVVIAPAGSYGGAELSELIAHQAITHLLITPSALATLDTRALGGVGTIIIGGEAAPQDLVDRWSVGRRVCNAYGPTETTCSVTMTVPLSASSDAGIGNAMVGVVIHLLDRSLRPVPAGAVGEIYIDSPGIARGYLGRSAQTASRFVANPIDADGNRVFRSGDRARLRGDGTLEFLGRTDDQVKIRGNRVELGEIDTALRAHPDVAAAASCVRRTRTGDLRIDGYVVSKDMGKQFDAKHIRSAVKDRLPAHMVPTTITVLESIPLTINRKIDRAALPEPDLATPDAEDRIEPSGATEEMVAAVFRRVLDRDDVDCATSFFDLGGDSLAATRVVASVRAEGAVDIGVRDLASSVSVQALAALVDERSRDGQQRLSRPERGMSDGMALVPLAPQQRHIDRNASLPLYNLPFTVEITGEFDADAASDAFADLVSRHHTLRTRYPESTAGPAQVLERENDSAPTIPEILIFDSDALRDTLERAFDVRAEFPIRARLFAVEPGRHILACAVHHIAADGWSLGVLATDFVLAYHARVSGNAPSWPELPIQYSDYSVWAVDRSASAEMDFWRTELAGLPIGAELPLDRPRPQQWDHAGARTAVVLDGAAIRGMDDVAQRCGTSRFTVLRAALLILVAEATATSDIVLGTPVANREDPRLEPLVGTFTNTVAIRTDLASASTFAEVVQLAHDSELRAFDHASIPFEEVAAELAPDAGSARHPIFQVALSLDVFSAAHLDVGDVRVEITPRPIDLAKCDLHVHVTEHLDGEGKATEARIEIVYPTALFDARTVVEFGLRFERIVREIVTDSDASWRGQPQLRTSA